MKEVDYIYKKGDRVRIVKVEKSWGDEEQNQKDWENLIGTIHTIERVSYFLGPSVGFMNNLKPFNQYQNWYLEYLELVGPIVHQYEFDFMSNSKEA